MTLKWIRMMASRLTQFPTRCVVWWMTSLHLTLLVIWLTQLLKTTKVHTMQPHMSPMDPNLDKEKSRMTRSSLLLRACWPVLTSPILTNLLFMLSHALIQMIEDLTAMSARPSPWDRFGSTVQGEKTTIVTNSSNEGIWIERGTILTLGVTIGRGNAATIVTHKYRVLSVFDKSYNKWFMTGEK